ncbi:MAG: hypothetical protein KA383_01095 [Phycisphaerae bacterium]|nr:hypothetical protein [Phycisphaerae bacterium]
MTRFAFALTVLTVAALTPAITWAHAHGEDFLIGVNAPTNQLEVEYDPDLYPFALPRSEHLLLVGWALDDPGLIGLDGPDPDDPDFVPVDAAADIGFELLAVSGTAFKVWNPLGPGETGFQILAGQTYNFPGLGDFHEHVWWHIDTTDPHYDPTVTAWDVTFRFVDLRTGAAHLASDPVTVTFAPEPSAALLLAAGVLAVARRRQSV